MARKYHLIHERGDVPPLPAEEVAIAWTSCIEKTVGFNNGPAFFVYEKGWGPIYCYEKNHQQIEKYIYNKINKDKKYTKKVKDIFEKRTQEIYDFVKILNRKKWEEANSEELIATKEKFRQIYFRFVPYGEPLPYFLKNKLEEVLGEYLIKKLGMSTKDYQILITPLYQSFLNREEQELFDITKKHKPQSAGYKKALSKHAKNYRWLLYDYASVIVEEKYFQEKVEEFKKNSPKFIDYRQLAQRKQDIINEYKVAEKYQYYLSILEDLFYLMDKKKEVLTRFNLALRPFYLEIAKRLKLDVEDLYWHFWQEVKKALEGQRKISAEIAAARRHQSVTKMHNWNNRFLSDREAEKFRQDIARDKDFSSQQKIVKGAPASSGKARGIVCHLKSSQENNKIKHGEILLVGNTTPDYMPAIKKAAAIVTNEGGLTCHAAIVSRELNVPCVVGTRIATQILNTGDKVEVDADKGIIKKL